MIMDFASAGLGILILFLAGDLLVQGAVNLGLRLRIPALIVSLTVVAFGTSAPELLVAIKAVIGGFPDLAMGNVVGSNIANVVLILGLPALAFTLSEGGESRRSYVTMLVVTLLFIGLAFTGPAGPEICPRRRTRTCRAGRSRASRSSASSGCRSGQSC